jgi:hypothetical protein
LTRHDGEAVALQAPPSDELPERVQCALETGNGLTVESLAQRVAAAPERALAAVRELVGRKQLHHWGEGEQERFFARDPLATLSERVPELLGSEAVGLVELRRRVEQHLPGHGLVLAEWLKHALRGGALFEGAPKGGGRVKTYACRPNLRRSLRRTLAALEGELPALRGAGLSRGEVAAFLADQLGALPDGGAPAPEVADPRTARGEGASGESNGARVALLKALHELEDESPRGALLSVRELRGRCGLEKPTFDRAALELAVQGRVSLHAHDHAAALLEAERRSLIEDARGVHYVGIASVGDACQEVGIL